jgi:Domain of unknown function (DUF1905)/Bacteriocin-protection, YdeI or OmpD-Associated
MDTPLYFTATIKIIGVNPYVLLPVKILKNIFLQSGKNKSPIPVKGTVDGHVYKQTLVRYSGKWRLYINGPMLKAAEKNVGNVIEVSIMFDAEERMVAMHPKLKTALNKNKDAVTVFNTLPPSRQKEIVRYISHLKLEEAVERNVEKAVNFLLGKQRFIGRDKP